RQQYFGGRVEKDHQVGSRVKAFQELPVKPAAEQPIRRPARRFLGVDVVKVVVKEKVAVEEDDVSTAQIAPDNGLPVPLLTQLVDQAQPAFEFRLGALEQTLRRRFGLVWVARPAHTQGTPARSFDRIP